VNHVFWDRRNLRFNRVEAICFEGGFDDVHIGWISRHDKLLSLGAEIFRTGVECGLPSGDPPACSTVTA